MNGIERRTWTPLGWPRAGALVTGDDGVPRVPIHCGNGQIIWVATSAYGRQLLTALTVAVNYLEALPTQAGPDPEPQVESTAVLPAVTDDPQPESGDQLVHPATAQEATDADR